MILFSNTAVSDTLCTVPFAKSTFSDPICNHNLSKIYFLTSEPVSASILFDAKSTYWKRLMLCTSQKDMQIS